MHSRFPLILLKWLGCWHCQLEKKGQVCAPQSAVHSDGDRESSHPLGKILVTEHPQLTKIMNLFPILFPILLIDYFVDECNSKLAIQQHTMEFMNKSG